jgi:hypothetical protein
MVVMEHEIEPHTSGNCCKRKQKRADAKTSSARRLDGRYWNRLRRRSRSGSVNLRKDAAGCRRARRRWGRLRCDCSSSADGRRRSAAAHRAQDRPGINLWSGHRRDRSERSCRAENQ